MEIYRFRYILAALMAITAIFQISSLLFTVLGELKRREHAGYSPDEPLSFALAIAHSQFWFIIPMLICIAVIGLYIFFIWYRDWIGRSTFIYRLLMLPTARQHIYWAKSTAIILFVFGLLSFQMLLIFIEKIIFNLIVPAEQRVESFFAEIFQSNQALELLFPRNFEQFIYTYGLGMIAVFVIFTAILLERSYRRIGILYGLLYLAVCVLVIAVPPLFQFDYSVSFLYPGEILAIEYTLCGLVLAASLLLGFRLLARRVSV